MTSLLPAVLYVGTFLAASCPCESKGHSNSETPGGSVYSAYGYGTPGGYEPRIGSPYYYSNSAPWTLHEVQPSGTGYWSAPSHGLNYGYTPTSPGHLDAYTYHFGPGYYRHSEFGHYRFPYYSYRRPWYFPGPASFNRDTNLPW